MHKVCSYIRFGDRLLGIHRPLVMAIINATPDSFYAGSRATDEASLRALIARAVDEGADILDIGACSTRPGVQAGVDPAADARQEWQRLSLALSVARQMNVQVPISVDTFRPDIAERAIGEFGVTLINDVSGGSDAMFDIITKHQVAYVLTYNRLHATERTDNILSDAMAFFSRKVDELHRRGVSDVIIDPGFGFGQSVAESLTLLDGLNALLYIGCPVLAGISRKRMAYEPAGLTPDTCLKQTLALEAQAIAQGATILRVHDIAATRNIFVRL